MESHDARQETSEVLDFLSPLAQDLNAQPAYQTVFSLIEPFANSLLNKDMSLNFFDASQRVQEDFFSLPEVQSAFNLSNRSSSVALAGELSEREGVMAEEYLSRYQLDPSNTVVFSNNNPSHIHDHFTTIVHNKDDYMTNLEIRLSVLRQSLYSLSAVIPVNTDEDDDFI